MLYVEQDENERERKRWCESGSILIAWLQCVSFLEKEGKVFSIAITYSITKLLAHSLVPFSFFHILNVLCAFALQKSHQHNERISYRYITISNSLSLFLCIRISFISSNEHKNQRPNSLQQCYKDRTLMQVMFLFSNFLLINNVHTHSRTRKFFDKPFQKLFLLINFSVPHRPKPFSTHYWYCHIGYYGIGAIISDQHKIMQTHAHTRAYTSA